MTLLSFLKHHYRNAPMKTQIFLYPVLACFLVGCGGHEVQQQPVLSSRYADSVKAEWLRPHEAILRIRIDSEHPTDRFLGLEVTGNQTVLASSRTDQLMTHPFQRDYVVEPNEGQVELVITATVNDTVAVSRTILPRMVLDTRTQINLNLNNGHLRPVSSWIEECSEGAVEAYVSPDTVFVGNYLDQNGVITTGYEATSIALVLTTDGRHGTAVALSDSEGSWVFSSEGGFTGTSFETLDGQSREGLLNRRRTETDSLGYLFYSASLPYHNQCAFSSTDGYAQSFALLSGTDRMSLKDNDMLQLILQNDGAYIPSVAEMAHLYAVMNGQSTFKLEDGHFHKPTGAYLTSTESDVDQFYSIDMSRGAVTGLTSKRFVPLRLRLFYIF